jgi:ubiquinone/menaquinone biosynthesis C-methylase UbiE
MYLVFSGQAMNWGIGKMMEELATAEGGYPTPGKLEMIWGEGFMSPGGAEEVVRIVADHDITGCSILDIGCGLGGAAIVLVQRCGAGSVTGFDVQPLLVDQARNKARDLGLADRLNFVLGAPGPLPFQDSSFDAVFSKDAIIHVADKAAIYREAARVLRPGGRIFIGDWLTSDDHKSGPLRDRFLELAGHDFHLISLAQTGAIAHAAEFVDLELTDRQEWYLVEATMERDRLHGDLGKAFEERWGFDAFRDELNFWETLVEAVTEGVVRPGHVRARKK